MVYKLYKKIKNFLHATFAVLNMNGAQRDVLAEQTKKADRRFLATTWDQANAFEMMMASVDALHCLPSRDFHSKLGDLVIRQNDLTREIHAKYREDLNLSVELSESERDNLLVALFRQADKMSERDEVFKRYAGLIQDLKQANAALLKVQADIRALQ